MFAGFAPQHSRIPHIQSIERRALARTMETCRMLRCPSPRYAQPTVRRRTQRHDAQYDTHPSFFFFRKGFVSKNFFGFHEFSCQQVSLFLRPPLGRGRSHLAASFSVPISFVSSRPRRIHHAERDYRSLGIPNRRQTSRTASALSYEIAKLLVSFVPNPDLGRLAHKAATFRTGHPNAR